MEVAVRCKPWGAKGQVTACIAFVVLQWTLRKGCVALHSCKKQRRVHFVDIKCGDNGLSSRSKGEKERVWKCTKSPSMPQSHKWLLPTDCSTRTQVVWTWRLDSSHSPRQWSRLDPSDGSHGCNNILFSTKFTKTLSDRKDKSYMTLYILQL